MPQSVDEAIALVDSDEPQARERLTEWLSIRSVSPGGEHADEIGRSATWLETRFGAMGMSDVRRFRYEDGNPLVTAEWMEAGPDALTILVYGHGDTQPAHKDDGRGVIDESLLWPGDPFEPIFTDTEVIARGAADDKGQVAALLDAIDYLIRTGEMPVNVRFVIEHGEEIGSPDMVKFFEDREAQDFLDVDCVLIYDTALRPGGVPVITAGLRGITSTEVILSGPGSEGHQGVFGGLVRNPNDELAELISAIQNRETREFTIPEIESSIDIPGWATSLVSEQPISDADWMSLAEVEALWTSESHTLAELVGIRPCVDVIGMQGGYTGPGMKPIIPTRASAKVMFRLVPGQDPVTIRNAFKAWVEDRVPDGIRVSFEDGQNCDACFIDPSGSSVYSVAHETFGAHFGKPTVYDFCGGAIGVVKGFRDRGLATLVTGIASLFSRIHNTRENLDLASLRSGKLVTIKLLADLAANHDARS